MNKYTQDVLHNFRVSTTEGMLANLAVGLVNPFLGLYAVSLGAPNIVVGLLTALPALMNVLMMIPSASICDRYPRKLPLVFWGGLISRLFYIPMAFIPFLPWFRGQSLVVLLTLMTLPAVVLNIAWTSLMSNLFPVHARGDLFSKRSMWCGLVAMSGTVLAGFLLDRITEPFNWTALFILAFISAMASTFVLKKHRETNDAPILQRRPYLTRLKAMLASDECGKRFKVFLITSCLFHLGLNFSAPLWAIYFGRELMISNSLVGGLTTVMNLTTVIFSMYWGRQISLNGDDFVFAIGLLGMGIWPALFALNPNPYFMLGLHAILGVFVAAFNLTLFNMLLSAAPYEFKSASIATFHTLNSLTGFIAPFLGTWSLSFVSIQGAMVISTVLRLSALVVFVWGCKESLFPTISTVWSRFGRKNTPVQLN